MKPIKKLQQLFAKIRDDEKEDKKITQDNDKADQITDNNQTTTHNSDQSNSNQDNASQDNDHQNDNNQNDSEDKKATRHLSPVSYRIKEWLDSKDWRYMHEKPDDDDDSGEHFFVLGFGSDDFSWHCIIRVQESNQLVSMQGIVHEDIPSDYVASIVAEFSRINANISIGSINLEPRTATVYTKVGFDAEFALLSDKMLNSYIHMLFALTEKTNDVVQSLLENPNPNPNIAHILKEQQKTLKKQNEQDETDDTFFLLDDGVQ